MAETGGTTVDTGSKNSIPSTNFKKTRKVYFNLETYFTNTVKLGYNVIKGTQK
jgi:hypothetical protein